jgi:small neutral amino acid transporter SnatA (MarC family)
MALAAALAARLGRQSLRWLRRAAGLLVIVLGLQAVWAGAKFFHVMLHL